MFFKKFQVMSQIVGTLTLLLLALYGLLALPNHGMAAFAAGIDEFEPSKKAEGVPALAWGEATVPLVMNYQGYVRDAEGEPLSGYYTITFRIYDEVTAEEARFRETHENVTVRDGQFTVLLGNIDAENNAIPVELFDEPDRFIGITVDPYDEMVPRQRLASVPFAMRAHDATNATNANHASQADYATEADHANQADRAFALKAQDGSQDAVMVDAEGNVGIGTTELGAKLNVDGAISYQAIQQVDLGTPTTYQVKATRYHVEASKAQVRNSVPLDMEIVNELCKDQDGCAVTLGMKDWNNSQPGNITSRGPYRFFISETSNWWRVSNTDTAGQDQNGTVNHIIWAWDCYFTDGEYSNGSSTDNSIQLGLLNWNATYNDPDMVCTLTIED